MSDYVDITTRRGGAIDPCLGYYMRSQMKQRARCQATDVFFRQPELDFDPFCIPTSFVAETELELPVDSPSALELVALESEELEGQVTDVRQKETVPLLSGQDILAVAHQETTTDSSAHFQGLVAVTVESFLYHSAKVRTYGGRKLPTKRLCTLPSGDEEDMLPRRLPRRVPRLLSDDDSDFGKPSQQLSTDIHPKMRRRKKRKPWKDRIYEAAIATHCVPDDCFIQSLQGDGVPADQTRAPLHFVPCSPEGPHAANLTRPFPSRSSSKNKQIDSERTRTVMRTSTFSDRHLRFVDAGTLVNSLDRLPLSKWRLDLGKRDQTDLTHAQLQTRKIHKKTRTTQARDVATRDVAYTPLTFIPLDEAEAEYKTLFTDHDARKSASQTLNHDGSGLKLVLVDETVSSATHTYGMSVHPADRPDDQQPKHHEEGLSPIACLPQSPAVSTASDLIDTSSSAAEGKIRLIEVSDPPPFSQRRVLARNERFQKDQQALYRPLKPLGSLMDAFLSNIRNVSRPPDSGPPRDHQTFYIMNKDRESRI